MNEVARAKGLSDLRTVTTHHISSKPQRKGTTYLDLFALSMERQRLEQELAGIERRRKRIFDRLADVQESMNRLVNAAEQEKIAQNSSVKLEPGCKSASSSPPSHGRKWRTVAVDY